MDDEYGKILFRQFELFMNNLPEIEGYGSGYEGIAVDALTSQIQSAVVLERAAQDPATRQPMIWPNR